MSAKLISGLEVSKGLLSDVAEKIKRQREQDPSFNAVLAIVQVGNRSDSNVYVGAKIKKAAEVGAEGKLIKLPDTITQEELEVEIDKLNKDDNIDGIIVQLPLDCKNPIDADAVIDKINPFKDVDGLTRENAGRLMRGELSRTIFPCTPYGCLYLVQKATGDENYVVGKNVVVLGRSKIVGAPAAALFLWHHGTTTKTHMIPDTETSWFRARPEISKESGEQHGSRNENNHDRTIKIAVKKGGQALGIFESVERRLQTGSNDALKERLERTSVGQRS
ncbi:tetrahydrofolate dehydrogenase/cyclohydrolase, catalytic domain protein [Teladorsagia circumcincta]|uniref:Tetrahydrofolate dehydrogenase/cyclohydrolase, catalytic domain protein n=1 Tax=Teladorsagia circumcincta TaxID=45464 RepID=A0A2G9U0F0_TELCI|nr:tetrahydrofolate dehydrogenase/cyclohydrolase, catalytic domain protein [Teladorsagia circumcincta]